MYRHMLVAVDGSDNAVRAAQEAARLASLIGNAKVELISVIAVDVYSDMVYDPIEAHGEAQREAIKAAVDVLDEAGVDHDVVLMHGRPADAIIRYARENDVDLIVIGSRGLNALQEFALGSVSHKVITHASCPVLVVK